MSSRAANDRASVTASLSARYGRRAGVALDGIAAAAGPDGDRSRREGEQAAAAVWHRVYFSNGVEPVHWWAKGAGADMELGPGLLPMMPHREDMIFLRGLFNQTAPSCPPVRTSARMNLLSGATVSLDPKEIRVGHVDGPGPRPADRQPHRDPEPRARHRAERAPARRRPVDDLRLDASRGSPPTKPATKEIYPSRTFDLLVGDGKGRRARPQHPRRSAGRTRGSLRPKISAADTQKLDEYLESIRDIEQRIERASKEERLEGWRPTLAQPNMPRPANELPQNVPEHMKLMLDLIVLAFQMDKTRIATLMLNNDLSQMNFKFLEGVQGALHLDLTHNGQGRRQGSDVPEDQPVPRRAVRLPPQTDEGDRRGRRHAARQLDADVRLEPVRRRRPQRRPDADPARRQGRRNAQAGRDPRLSREGRRTAAACSLYLSLMDRMGVKLDRFGDAQARLDDL